MLLEAGEYIIKNHQFSKLLIPEWAIETIINTWNDEPPCLNYGRFDFAFDGNQLKLLEFNCETPTSLLEASIIQWFWKEELFPQKDQFNSIHETLLSKWRDIKPLLPNQNVHFAYFDEPSGEDVINTAYMLDIAKDAGIETKLLKIDDIGWLNGQFIDLENNPINSLYKLYPWEWMLNEEFGKNILKLENYTIFIEPIWKMIWNNKAILPILSDLFPDSPYILKSAFSPLNCSNYVKKPILAREGANIEIYKNNMRIAKSNGPYHSNCIYQELADIPEFDGNYPIIGAWIVDGQPCGMGIREDGMITSNSARFVPHIIV